MTEFWSWKVGSDLINEWFKLKFDWEIMSKCENFKTKKKYLKELKKIF
jgi:hypothetical protein